MAGEEPLNLKPNGTLKLDRKSIKPSMLTCESSCVTVQWCDVAFHQMVPFTYSELVSSPAICAMGKVGMLGCRAVVSYYLTGRTISFINFIKENLQQQQPAKISTFFFGRAKDKLMRYQWNSAFPMYPPSLLRKSTGPNKFRHVTCCSSYSFSWVSFS